MMVDVGIKPCKSRFRLQSRRSRSGYRCCGSGRCGYIVGLAGAVVAGSPGEAQCVGRGSRPGRSRSS